MLFQLSYVVYAEEEGDPSGDPNDPIITVVVPGDPDPTENQLLSSLNETPDEYHPNIALYPEDAVTDSVSGAGYAYDYETATLTINDIEGFGNWKSDAFDGLTGGSAEMTKIYPIMIQTVDIGENIYSVPGGAFASGTISESADYEYHAEDYDRFLSLTNVTFPTTLTDIAGSAFLGAEALYADGTLTFPASLTHIGKNAFSHSGLSNVDFSNLTNLSEIGEYAFADTALTTVDLSNNPALTAIDPNNYNTLRTFIETGAFANNANLTSVTLPVNTATISDDAFSNCSALSSVNFTDLTELKTIGSGAFSRCTALGDVNLSNCLPLYSIGNDAFNGCYAMNSIIFPHNQPIESGGHFYHDVNGAALSIYNGAFANTGLTGVIELPCYVSFNNDKSAVLHFSGSNGIEGFRFSEAALACNCGLVRYYTEADLRSAEYKKLGDVPPSTAYTETGFYVTHTVAITSDGALYTANHFDDLPHGFLADLVFAPPTPEEPGTFKLDPFARIIDVGAAANRSDITRVVIPASVQVIANDAFKNCTNLTTVTFETGSNLIFVGKNAFAGCTSLEEFVFPQKASPGESATATQLLPIAVDNDVFAGSGLKRLTIPSNLMAASSYAAPPQGSDANYQVTTEPLYAPTDPFSQSESLFLEHITVNHTGVEKDEYLFDIDGVLYAIANTTSDATKEYIALIQFPQSKGGDTYNINAALSTLRNSVRENTNSNPIKSSKIDALLSNPTIVFTHVAPYAFYNVGANVRGPSSVFLPPTTAVIGKEAFGASVTSSITLIDIDSPEQSVLTTFVDAASPFSYGAAARTRAALRLFLPKSLTSIAVAPNRFYQDSSNNDRSTSTESLMLSVYRGSYAHTWATNAGISVFYRASGETMEANPPDVIYQYIPYQFVPATTIIGNADMTFSITSGELPDGLRLVTGIASIDKSNGGVPEGLVPGTIYGILYKDMDEYPSHDIPITLTAHSPGKVDDSVNFVLHLESYPKNSTLDMFTIWGNPNNAVDVDSDSENQRTFNQTFFFIGRPGDAGNLTHGDIVTETARSAWVNRRYASFVSVSLNGRVLAEGQDYVSNPGSTKITLTEQTLSGLPAGEYTLAAAFLRTDFESTEYGTELNNDLEVLVSNFVLTDDPTAQSNLPGEVVQKPGDAPVDNPIDNSENNTENTNNNTRPGNVFDNIPSAASEPIAPPDNDDSVATADTPSVDVLSDDSTNADTQPDNANVAENDTPAPASDDDTQVVVEPPAGGGTPVPANTQTVNPPQVYTNTILSELTYDSNGRVLLSFGQSHELRLDSPFDLYRETLVDGVAISVEAREGSTILTLSASTLEEIGEGEHMLEVVFEDDVIEIPITLLSVSNFAAVGSDLLARTEPDAQRVRVVVIVIAAVVLLGGAGAAFYVINLKKKA